MENRDIHAHIWDATAQKWIPDTGSGGGGGGTASLTKAVLSDVQEVTTVSGGLVLASDELDVTNYKDVLLSILHAPLNTATPTFGTEYRIEVNSTESANAWRTLHSFRTFVAAAATAITQAENPAQTLIEFNPTPSYTTTDIVAFQNIIDITKSEWHRLADIDANVHLELVDGLQNTQESSSVYNKCEEFVSHIDCSAIKRLRAVCHNNIGSSGLVMWKAEALASYEG